MPIDPSRILATKVIGKSALILVKMPVGPPKWVWREPEKKKPEPDKKDDWNEFLTR